MKHVVIENEININYDGTLAYTDISIIGSYDTESEAETKLSQIVDEVCARGTGYFNKIISKKPHYALLTNGGTSYKKFVIRLV